LADIIALTAIREVDFYSFQTPLFAADRALLHEHGVTDLEPEQTGFTDTGALLQHMDLLVSVPSTTAHLAGALGVPAVVLLSDPADWHWASDGTASAWYPSVQILQRTAADEWHRVLASCAERINSLGT
jgi:ADP-heptose:LPS heptosyltransferase